MVQAVRAMLVGIGLLLLGMWACAPVGLGRQVPGPEISPPSPASVSGRGWWIVAGAGVGIGMGVGLGLTLKRRRKRAEGGVAAARKALKLVSLAMSRGPGARVIRFRHPSRK